MKDREEVKSLVVFTLKGLSEPITARDLYDRILSYDDNIFRGLDVSGFYSFAKIVASFSEIKREGAPARRYSLLK